MTIALDRTTAPLRSPSSPRALHRVTALTPRSQAPAEGVTITVTVTLPPGTGDVEAALIADDLRTHSQRLTASRKGRTAVSVSSPSSFSAAPAPANRGIRSLPPRRSAGTAAVSPLRPRGTGVVSPNSPARKDVEAARRRALVATAVSPSSPSTEVEDGLVVDLYGRRVRLDGRDVELTYKEFELLSQLARSSRRTVSREELMETVWSESPADTGERTVDVHVRRVRTKLGRYRRLISTVRGAGYRLDPGSDVALLGL